MLLRPLQQLLEGRPPAAFLLLLVGPDPTQAW
jgi:hypothetical protein